MIWIVLTAVSLLLTPPLTKLYMWYISREYHERNDYPRGW